MSGLSGNCSEVAVDLREGLTFGWEGVGGHQWLGFEDRAGTGLEAGIVTLPVRGRWDCEGGTVARHCSRARRDRAVAQVCVGDERRGRRPWPAGTVGRRLRFLDELLNGETLGCVMGCDVGIVLALW